MRVLFCIRNDYMANFAGDSMQFLETIKYLRKKGIEVEINYGQIDDYSSYDIVHIFNITRIGESYKYYKKAIRYEKIIAVSPIYWDLEKYYKFIGDKHSLKVLREGNKYRREVLEGCNIIYPNSIMEKELIRKNFNTSRPFNIIYNGMESENNHLKEFDFKKYYHLKEYVLCVARICPRKNQLVLGSILDKYGYDLVLIGKINDRAYFNQCIKYKNVKYLGFMNRNNIYSAYRKAKLHILPSFVETPGLSSLEAASAGCRIVSTSEGSTREYFKDMCLYCNPYDNMDIEKSIISALQLPENDKLKEYVNYNYNWEKCIDDLYESYKNFV